MVPLTFLPTHLRPREKLAAQGVGTLCLEEIIAVLIGTGSRSEGVLQTSARIASYLESEEVTLTGLSAIRGVGLAKAAVIIAALELSAGLEQRKRERVLLQPEDIYKRCWDFLDEPQEHLVVFFLSARGGQIGRHIVTIGTATASLVHAREVFRPAISNNATYIAMAHNHPSGDTTPSEADLETTKKMVSAGQEIGIEVLDHVVCGRGSFFSLKEHFPDIFSW